MPDLRLRTVGFVAAMMVATSAHAQVPTFNGEVAGLLHRACVPCHHPEGDAPFSLVTYEEARQRARLILEATASRYMPPWKPAPGGPRFTGERSLTEAELDVLQRWVEGGVPLGRESAPVVAPVAEGWLHGEPDLIVPLPSYVVPIADHDIFRNFVVGVPVSDTRYVRAFQFLPRNRAVHHANIRVDATPASRQLDDADPAPGYSGLILHSATYPDGFFLGWTPGHASPPLDDLAWRLAPGSDLVVQLHLKPTGKLEEIAPLLGLYFADEPPDTTPVLVRLGRQDLDIAPGDAAYRVTDTLVLPVDAELRSLQPHAHVRARSVAVTAQPPGGSEMPLLRISDWDFNWQDQYVLAEPVRLSRGTRLTASWVFDNSAGNPRNPVLPPARVRWGWYSDDEMADVWLQLVAGDDAERKLLARTSERHAAEADAVGAEVLIARQPDHIAVRHDAALIYLELGRPERAHRHFAAVARIAPESAPAHYNEGVALEALGRHDEAVTPYQKAILLDFSYVPARLGLARTWSRLGQLELAALAYGEAVQLAPSSAEAHCGLARVLTQLQRPLEAFERYRAGIALKPDWVPCLINFAWLLSAHADSAIRRPELAVEMAERAADLTHYADPEALDVLAAAYASAGRFDQAVQFASAALHVQPPPGLRQALGERLASYRRGIPFVVVE